MESVRCAGEGWGRWKYSAHMVRPWGLQSSAIAIGLLAAMGRLADVPAERRAEAVAFFQGCQDAADGYFKDPLVSEADRAGDAHSWEHIWLQMSGAARALRLLGAEPLYGEPRCGFVDAPAAGPAEWVDAFDWSDPWMAAERWSAVVMAQWRLPAGERRADEPVTAAAFETLESSIINASTGMPTGGGCRQADTAMAGLFKLTGAYLTVGRPLPHPERAMDFVLALQRPSGEFGRGRDMCINWDAVHVLAVLARQLGGSHRGRAVAAAGNRLAEALLRDYRKSDGGFAFCGEHCLTVHNSIRVSGPLPESDVLGTSMSRRCLAQADEWNATHG